MRGLKNKRVLVTGAATGIGRATAQRFAEEGANVAINFIGEPEPAEHLLDELSILNPGGTHILAPANVADEDAVDSLFAEVVVAFGGLDILVNNAGILVHDEPHRAKIADFDRVMAVNLRGAFLCAQAAIQHFLDAGHPGVIVSTSSIHATVPHEEGIAYMMSKAGVNGMTRTLAARYARHGIRVNAVGPGSILTPMNAEFTEDPSTLRRVERTVPMGRVGRPEEIAAAIVFLSSDDAAYITGQTLYVDGALMLGRPG
jgi:glucose 1-dehydrogenase